MVSSVSALSEGIKSRSYAADMKRVIANTGKPSQVRGIYILIASRTAADREVVSAQDDARMRLLFALFVLTLGVATHQHEPTFYVKDILGTWQGDCGPVSSTGLPGNGSFIRRYNFDRSIANVRYVFFTDDACSSPLFSFYAIFGLDLGAPLPGLPYTRALLAPFVKLTVRPDSEVGAQALAPCNATTVGLDHDVTLSGCSTFGFKPVTECIGDHDLLKVIPGKSLTAGFRTPNMCIPEGQPTRTEDDLLAMLVADA